MNQEQAQREHEEALERLRTYAKFFDSPNGRKILELLRISLDGSTFRPDPYESAYRAGRRSVYLDIINALEVGQEVLQAPDSNKAQTRRTRAQMPASLEEL